MEALLRQAERKTEHNKITHYLRCYEPPAALMQAAQPNSSHPSGSAILSSRSVRASCASTSASSRLTAATLSLSSCTATSAKGQCLWCQLSVGAREISLAKPTRGTTCLHAIRKSPVRLP